MYQKMGGTRFMVQWEEHPSHLATRLGQLLEHQTLVDVTLMCNTHTLRVHRAVLAACSPYFETILQRQLGMYPLIVLKDMQFSVLKSLIEFMYCGETSVTEDNLSALLQAAKFFQVKGLSAMTKEALGLTSTAPKTTTINGDSARKAFVGRSKRVGMQQTFVASGLKTSSSTTHAASSHVHGSGGDMHATTSGKTIFQTTPKSVPVRQDTHQQQQQQTDTAQLLLSLSGTEFPKQTFHTVSKNVRFHHGVSSSGAVTVEPSRSCPLESSVVKNKEAAVRSEVIDRVPVVTPNGGVKPASVKLPTQLTDKGKEQPAVPEKVVETAKDDLTSQMLFVEDGPCKRGRPLKRQMNLVFQEKVLTDAEMALQKEAEASRKALEMLQQEMSTGDETSAAGVTQSADGTQQKIMPVKQILSKGPTPQPLNNILTTAPRILRKEPVASTKLVSTKTDIVTQLTSVNAPEPSSQDIINQVAGNAVSSIDSGNNETNIVYQLEEGVIAGQDSSSGTNIVYQVADNAMVSGQDSSSQNIIYQVADNTGTSAEGSNGTNIIYQVADNSNAGSGSAMSQYMEVLKEAGLPSDVPILLESSDGSYVTVNEEVLMNIMNGGVIQVGDGSIVGGEGVQFIVQEVQEVTEGQVEAAEASAEQLISAEMNVTENIAVNEQTEIKENSSNIVEPSATTETDADMVRPLKEQGTETCGKEEATDLPSLERNEAMDIELAASQNENTTAIACSGNPVQYEVNQMVMEETGVATDSTPVEVDHGVMPQSTTEPPSHSDEIITGDGYGEEAMEGFAVMDTKGNVGRTRVQYAGSDTTNFTFPEQTCSKIVEDKSFPTSGSEKVAEVPENGGMSVEQALQAMMGEGSDTEMEVCADTDADGMTKVRPIISHRDTKGHSTQNEGSIDEETEDLRLVLSPDDDSVKVEDESRSTGEGSINDSFTLALSSPDSTGNDKTHSEARNMAESAEGGQQAELKSGESDNDIQVQINQDGAAEVKYPFESTLTSVLKSSGSVGVDILPSEAGSVEKSENSNSVEINESETDEPRLQAVTNEVDTVPVEISNIFPLQSNSDPASETKSHEPAATDAVSLDKTKQGSESNNISANKCDDETTKVPISSNGAGKEILSETNSTSNIGFSSNVDNMMSTEVARAGTNTAICNLASSVHFDCSNTENSVNVSGRGDDKSLPVKALTDPVTGTGDEDVDKSTAVNELFDSSRDASSAEASVLVTGLKNNTDTELDSFVPGTVQQGVTGNVLTAKQDRERQDTELSKEATEIYFNSVKGTESKETAKVLHCESDPENKPGEDGKMDSESNSGKATALVENQDNTELTSAGINTGENALQTHVDSGEGAVSSPSKDIPYAVGLLPLKTALEKLQAMPEYHPRKTRSASSGKESGGEVPANRLKRKASSSADNLEKKMKPCDADDGDGSYDSEGTMVMAVEDFDGNTMLEATIAEDSKTTLISPSPEESVEAVAVESKMEALMSTMELVSDSSDAV